MNAVPALDLTAPRRIHIIGIGGAAMSGIATLLTRLGHTVTGSDLRWSRGIDRLRAMGIPVVIGHDGANIPAGVDAVAISTAIPRTNPEIVAAEQAGVPVLRRADVLRLLVAVRRTVAISGTHGKTTTSSMVALILRQAGWQPSFLIGGDVNEIGTNAVFDSGEWLVIEADESDGAFLAIEPEAVVVTNVDLDHLDHYGDFEHIVAAFATFLGGVSGPRVASADDPTAAALAARIPGVVTFGTSAGASYRIDGYAGARAGCEFDLVHDGTPAGTVRLPVPGLHNARNAAAAAAVALELGAGFDDVVAALARFGGVARRYQFRGEARGVTFVDDYAHNPGKVRAVLAAAQEGGWRRVIAVFQPHRYSRTADLWQEFADAFVDADVVFVTDVYGADEPARPGVTGQLIVDAIAAAHPGADVRYVMKRTDAVAPILATAGPGDLVLTLGAGDITALPDDLLAAASRQ